MKKKLLALILAVSAALSLCTGCSAPSPGGNTEKGLTFTDDMDRTVTVEAEPERVAVLIGSFADVWCLAGGRESLVAAADDTWTQFDLGLDASVAHLGGVKATNVEALLAAEPDLVIGSARTSGTVELEEMLTELGVPVLYFDVSSFSDYLRMLEICTQITGQTENYKTYGTDIQAQVDRAIARADGSKPSVLYVRATGKSCKVKNSEGTVLGEMLSDLGCVNIADSETGLLENLSMETILAADPDYIFTVLQGSDSEKAQDTLEKALLSNPAWESLTAVREGRFHILDQKLYNLKPNAKLGDAYEQLADILYPAQ